MSTPSESESVLWLKRSFRHEFRNVLEGTPFCEDLLCAIALQETGYLWRPLIEQRPIPDILRICVGDTIDARGSGGRRAFPKHRRELEAHPRGKSMFRIARDALLAVAEHSGPYARVAKKPHKFCRAFGIFQYDLQFFDDDPDFFLQRKWSDFGLCLGRFVRELYQARSRQGWKDKEQLSEREKIFIAIAYNRGRADPRKGLRQGYKSGGEYYGERIARYLALASSVRLDPDESFPRAIVIAPPPGISREIFRVTGAEALTVHDSPSAESSTRGSLTPGQIVVRRSVGPDGDWWRVEATRDDTILDGWCRADRFEPANRAAIELPHSPPIDFDRVPDYVRRELSAPGVRIARGTRHREVRRVQEWLNCHRIHTAVDGDFGSASEASLAGFRESRGLSGSGALDAATWTALVEPLRLALEAGDDLAGQTRPQAVAAVAGQHVAQHPIEVGGANRGPWVRLYCGGHDGPQWLWCAAFVSFLLKQACFHRGEDPPLGGSPSCDLLAAQAMAAGRFVTGQSIIDGRFRWADFGGAAIFLRRRSAGDWNHAGLALESRGTGRNLNFDTIEGNTNDEGSREGYEACRRNRSLARGDYDFVRLD